MSRINRNNINILKKRLILLIFVAVIVLVINCIHLLILSNKTREAYSPIYIESSSSKISKASFPDNVFGVTVFTNLVDESSLRRPGTKREIKYVVLHETGNPDRGATAELHAMFLKDNFDDPTSWHYTVDDTEIYHHIPDNEVAWHAGEHEGNLYGIGIEMCINKDGNFEQTFKNATKLVAYLLKEYELDIDSIKTHKDFSGKECPTSILKNNRINEFKNEIKKWL